MGHTSGVIKALRPEFPEFEILSGYDDNLVHNVMSWRQWLHRRPFQPGA